MQSTSEIKAAIAQVIPSKRMHAPKLVISPTELSEVCKILGLKITPYLAIEAQLCSCGGYKEQGRGEFDIELFQDWIRRR